MYSLINIGDYKWLNTALEKMQNHNAVGQLYATPSEQIQASVNQGILVGATLFSIPSIQYKGTVWTSSMGTF